MEIHTPCERHAVSFVCAARDFGGLEAEFEGGILPGVIFDGGATQRRRKSQLSQNDLDSGDPIKIIVELHIREPNGKGNNVDGIA